MKSAASCEGASRTRAQSGRWTMTSDSGPSGELGQWPTTTRVPDAVPIPRIQPSNRSRRAIRSEGGGAAAVDRDDRAGDVGAGPAGKVDHDAGHVVGPADAP